MPEEPVLQKFKNIECRDAVLAYDGDPQPALDENGIQKTVWDRQSFKPDMLTGRNVPDETKRGPLLTYCNPHPAEWPQADFIVGNPPFLGNKRMREHLGDGYAETLRETYPSVPESAEFVLYWWHKAADLVRTGKARRFGLITTNSLRQTFARRVVETHLDAKPPLSLAFAIPDHPWVDTADGAAVRIAMTVGNSGRRDGELLLLKSETPQNDGSAGVTFNEFRGRISADITVGANVGAAVELHANENLAIQGAIPHGDGFRLNKEELTAIGYSPNKLPPVIKEYWIGNDIVQTREERWVIDFYGLTEQQARDSYPRLFQRVLTLVKPDRDQNKRASRRNNWWLFAENVPFWRRAAAGLPRFIGTCRTAKHRLFTFLPQSALPDAKIIGIALEDAFFLGVLSSRIHVLWSLRTGSFLEDRPNYNHSECFGKFPFPECADDRKQRIRFLGDEIDAHRKRVQASNSRLTLTDIYNVLEKLRAGEPLNNKDKQIHDAALVSVLRQLHDDLDAYAWPKTLTDAEILERLVALNAQRAKEESTGLIRYLRPDYQNPAGTKSQQTTLGMDEKKSKSKKRSGAPVSNRPAKKLPWPKKMSDRVKAVHTVLSGIKDPITPEEMAKNFARADAKDIAEILETLTTMGHAKKSKGKSAYLP